MANQTPDIRILVGNRGDASTSGESAVLIRTNLEKALSDGIKIKVELDTAQLDQIKKQLQGLSDIKIDVGATGKSGAGEVPLADWEGATVSTRKLTQAQAELLKVRVQGISALDQEELTHRSNIHAIQEEAEAAKTTTVLLKQEEAQRKILESTRKREEASSNRFVMDKQREAKVLSDASLKLAQFNNYLQTVDPKGIAEYQTQIAFIRDGLSSGDPIKIKSALTAVNELKAGFKSAGYEGGNVFTYPESKVKTFATYLVSSALTMGVVTGVRNVISTVTELDGSLTDLRIVTGGTRAETERLLSTYNQMAQELGSTTAKVANSAVEWQRQGYSISDSNTLIKDSMVLSIVGFIDETQAATALTAAMKGYQLSVDEAMSVVDKFTATDMVAASSAGTLAEALAKTAANAKLAGLSMDDVIAQLAVVNETMQESGEQTGTFYNTMLSRMGAIKSGRLSDPETSEDLSDVEATLGGLGIKLRDSESEFRNFGEVLDEVGGKWDSFSSVQQRAIATAFSGTRQQTRFLSLMSGWDQAQKYAEVAAGSAGTALEKFGVYQESVEAKTQSMTAAFEAMSTSLLDSGLIEFVLDLSTGLFNFVSGIPDAVKNMAILTAGLITLKSALAALGESPFGKNFIKNFKDLGWPETTGDKLDIVPSGVKEAA